jgi:hypothetical protein
MTREAFRAPLEKRWSAGTLTSRAKESGSDDERHGVARRSVPAE